MMGIGQVVTLSASGVPLREVNRILENRPGGSYRPNSITYGLQGDRVRRTKRICLARLIVFPLILFFGATFDAIFRSAARMSSKRSGFSGASLAAEAITRPRQRRAAALLCNHRPAERDRIASFAKSTNVQAGGRIWYGGFRFRRMAVHEKARGLAGGL